MTSRLSRREVIAGAALSLGSLAGCASDGGDDGNTGRGTGTPTGGDGRPSETVGTMPVADGFTSPVAVVPFDSDRFLVADQPGRLELVDEGETETVLDLGDRVVDVSGYSEQGLLGVAIHPTDDRLFVRYSAPPRDGTPTGYSHTFVLAEFAVEPGSGAVDPASEQSILEIPEPQPNHNAGDLAFGPDGYLYVPVGDGGAANDQGNGHTDDWYDAVGGGNGQDVTENLLGSLLRIDVDAGEPYDVPSDNPLVGTEGLDEHYAWGFRNPWRLSFGPGGRCFIADVGQNRFEEVNIVEPGENYGWNVREGTHCHSQAECPATTRDGKPLRPPVIEYPHDDAPVSGLAVIGGRLYRGSAIASLTGRYVFGDWISKGRLFVASEAETGLWPTETLPIAGDDAGGFLLSIDEDPAGELMIATSSQQGVRGSSGAVHRLVEAD